MISHDPASNAIEPRQCHLFVGDIIDPTPGDGEYLGHRIGDLIISNARRQ